jgi:ATP-dependent RNA helicase DeaD
VADVREHRLDLLRGTLRETLVEGGFERYRAVVEPLTGEFDLVDIALAAVSLIEGAEVREEDAVELQPAFLNEPPPQVRTGPAGRGGPGSRGGAEPRTPTARARPPGKPHSPSPMASSSSG